MNTTGSNKEVCLSAPDTFGVMPETFVKTPQFLPVFYPLILLCTANVNITVQHKLLIFSYKRKNP